MNDQDRQNAGRPQQAGGGYRSQNDQWDSPRQPSQWQPDESGQTGGNWTSDQHTTDDYTPDYRFSGNRAADNDARSGRLGSRRQGEPEAWLYERVDFRADLEPRYHSLDRGQDAGSGDYRRGMSGRGGYRRRNRGRDDYAGYMQRDYDTAYGNNFASFTSEDYGGRDFYANQTGYGGMGSQDSYRPSYGFSRWFRDDYGSDDRSSREYGNWRKFGEERGFLKRAGDEIASWFGDDDAARRREMDKATDHAGRGPVNYTRSDERIREDANDNLTHDRWIDASNITVSVMNGEITLDGTVHSRVAKRRAEDCVDGISGVRHVQNNLRVDDVRTGLTTDTSAGQGTAASSTSRTTDKSTG